MPNPWIALPSLTIGLLAGLLGWVVTDLSCRSDGASCPGWSALLAMASFIAATIGVGLVLVLVYRSLGEWREGAGSDPAQDQ